MMTDAEEMTLFAIRLELPEGGRSIEYDSIAACLHDSGLRTLLDSGTAEASVHAGSLRVTARPITTWEELASQIARNASTILAKYR